MRRVFSYILFLFGLFIMALAVLAIFFGYTDVGKNPWLAVGMAAFGLILCLIGFFISSAGTGPDGA